MSDRKISSFDRNSYRKFGFFISSCLFFLGNSVLLFFRFMAGYLFRIKNSEASNTYDSSVLQSREFRQVKKFDEKVENRTPAFSFKYQSQNFVGEIRDTEEEAQVDEIETRAISEKKDEPYLNAADIHNSASPITDGHESFIGLEEDRFNGANNGARFLTVEDFLKPAMEEESNSDDYNISDSDYEQGKTEGFIDLKNRNFEEGRSNSLCSEIKSMEEREIRFISEDFCSFDSDTESSIDGYSVKELTYDSEDIDELLSENSINKFEEDGIIAEKFASLVQEEINSCEVSEENELTGNQETDSASPITDSLQIEFIENSSDEELSSVKNGSGEVHFVEDEPNSEQKAEIFDREEVGKIEDDKSSYDLTKSAKGSEESKSLNFDSEELDELWEHQDLIEQLKMELKKVRAVGLPTILEESESPRTLEDLRPFRIDEKFLREDPMDELQKFYKCYRERMRKFDILNYQKMYAMGFLQMKNPMWTQRHLFSIIMSHLSQNLLPFCQKKFENNPTEKLFKDLQCDLEIIYVGQTCLSWEFLRWQYEKSRELPESDPHKSHQYNKVADEFQQFQVLVQRFTENEPFQGPRLPNYVKQRCVLRNLLQVPVMKEDSLKDSMEKKEGDNVITSEMLEDVMEEAIRVFWEFIKAEKHETPVLIRVLTENNVEVQDPYDYEFMEEIQSNLQKKEKKLKDLLRTGNCLVKKFKKPREDRSNQDLFFSQVDLKLVSRVLKMPRITSDQLIWCQKKLSKITFYERRLQREPSFLLFPC